MDSHVEPLKQVSKAPCVDGAILDGSLSSSLVPPFSSLLCSLLAALAFSITVFLLGSIPNIAEII